MKKLAWTAICLILLLAACSSNNGTNLSSATTTQREDGSANGPAKQTSEGASSDDPVKLTFAAYYLSDQMEAAVQEYERLHPNVEIDLQATPSYGKDLNEVMANNDKFVTGTNTAMLAGRGPDLVELDVLPIDAYANRGLLVDLGEMMAGDSSFRADDYFTNILDNAAIDGGLYGMPLYFSIVGLLADEDAIDQTGVKIDDSDWTWDDFIQAAKQLQEHDGHRSALIGDPSYMLSDLASVNFAQLVTEKNGEKSFNADVFAGLMEQVQEMKDSGMFYDFTKEGAARGPAVATKAEAFFSTRAEIGSFERYLAGNTYGENTKLYTMPHPQNTAAGGYFSTFGTIGINASSPHKEAAWDFIRFLTEDEEQSSADIHGSGRGFPISQRVYDAQADKLKEAGTMVTESKAEVAVDTAKLEELKRHIVGAVHWARTPSDLDETIVEESKAFFNGQKSAEDVAKLVKNKIELILNE